MYIILQLEKGVDGLFDSFARLDSRISSVGQTAAKIGDHLQVDLVYGLVYASDSVFAYSCCVCIIILLVYLDLCFCSDGYFLSECRCSASNC